MKRYQFTLHHDNGIVKITTIASCLTSAINIILAAEGCPESSIRNIKITEINTKRK